MTAWATCRADLKVVAVARGPDQAYVLPSVATVNDRLVSGRPGSVHVHRRTNRPAQSQTICIGFWGRRHSGSSAILVSFRSCGGPAVTGTMAGRIRDSEDGLAGTDRRRDWGEAIVTRADPDVGLLGDRLRRPDLLLPGPRGPAGPFRGAARDLFGTRWYPIEGYFGVLPLITGSLIVTAGAMAMADSLRHRDGDVHLRDRPTLGAGDPEAAGRAPGWAAVGRARLPGHPGPVTVPASTSWTCRPG